MEKELIQQEKKQKNSLTLGFLGLGLIGGSIAKSARRIFPNCTILAFDPDSAALADAIKEGVVSIALTGISNELQTCDYIFLCAPVRSNIMYLPLLKSLLSPTCILTDVGSVKTDIYEAILENHLENYFIGGHPMVGSEKSGYHVSKDNLIENAYYFLTPSPMISEEQFQRFSSFIESLGALPIRFTPEYHDRVTSTISHLPHVVAASLVNLARQEDTSDGLLKRLAAGGFKDITRIASSSPAVWESILLSNSSNIVEQITQFQQYLEEMKQAILEKNSTLIYDFFEHAKEYRNSLSDSGVGAIQKNHDIYVDVVDQPGVLAVVTTLLGANQISIKNIGIIHSREYEEGALQVSFYDDESARFATTILEKYRFTVYKR